MPRTDYKSVGQYLADQPRPSQTALRKVISAIRAAVPKAKAVISYQIVAFKLPRPGTRELGGEAVLYVAAFKRHFSLYPATDSVIARFKGRLGNGEIISRTMRFPLSEPVPVKLIERIARFRAKEVAQRAAPPRVSARRPRRKATRAAR